MGLARTASFEGPWVRTAPTVIDDVAYVGPSGGLQALSQTSGASAWSTANTGEGAAFSYADGVRYVTRSTTGTAGTAGLTAVSASTGATFWTRPIPGAGDLVAPAVAPSRSPARVRSQSPAALCSR